MQGKFATVGKNARGFAEATNRVGKAAQSAGKGAEKGAKGLGKFAASLLRIAQYRFLRSMLKALTEAFQEGLENLYNYSNGMSGEAHRMASALDGLATANQTMKNQIGSAWGELRSLIMPVVESIIRSVQSLADWLSQLFAAFGGNGSYYKAVDASTQWAKSTAAGAKSAKEMRRQLMGFDEINRLDAPTEPSGGGGGGANKDASKMFDYVPIADNIKSIADTIKANMPLIELALGGFMLGLGAILTFTGANVPLGLALMAAGAATMKSALNLDWSTIPSKLVETFSNIATIVGLSLIAIGAVLLFTAHPMIGIGLLAAGFASFAVGSLAWGKITGNVKEQLTNILGLGALLLMGLGVILLMTGNVPLGVGLLIAGGAMGVAAVAINWDAILDHLKETWNGIKTWYETNVKKYFTQEYWQGVFDKMFDVVASIPMPIITWTSQPVWDWLAPVMDFFGLPTTIPVPNVVWQSFATGGFPEDGLFMANHGELVGQFSNGNTAVANNEQIIAGIERGVYNAMTSALANQNDGGRDIRVFLDGKEIGAATRRYERSVNRATGVSMA